MTTPDNSQANGLLAWLRCDDASGNLLDSTPRRYDAVAQGNIQYQQAGKPLLGAGYSVRPTDANAIGLIDASDMYWNRLCPYVSVQAWVLFDGTAFNAMWGTKHALAHKSSSNADNLGWYLGVLPGGGNMIVFKVMDAATSPYVASYTETDFSGVHHYVGTFDGNYVRLYRDGVKVGETFVSGVIGHDPTYPVQIAEGLQARIDDIAIWNRALTDAEVAQLYGQSGYIRPLRTYRVEDTFPATTGTIALDALDSRILTIGPFAEDVRVVSGDNGGTLPMTAPDDQWVINGSNWTTPAWVNTSTPHVIAAGTVLATLTAGQTLQIRLRCKQANQQMYAYGRVTVFGASALGDGLNIIQYVLASSAPVAYATQELTGDQYALGMNDQLLSPEDTVPDPMAAQSVSFDSDRVASTGAGLIDAGTVAAYDVFENVLVPPNPIVDSITVDEDHLMTLVGSAGWTNIAFVDLYWQIATSTGYLTIPVSDTWEPFALPNRQQFTTQYQIPPCIGLNGLAARFVAEANGPGSTDLAFRYYSPWVQLNGADFINPCPAIVEPPPVYPGAISPLADIAPVEGFDLYDVTAADLAQSTVYKPTPPIAVSTQVVADTNDKQIIVSDLPAGLYEFEYMAGALFDGNVLKWNYYNNTYFGQHMGGFWLSSGDAQPYYVIPAPCFTPAGFPSEADAVAASVGYKFLFLHTGGALYAWTDFAEGSGSVTVRVSSVDSNTLGTGEWTLGETTMVPEPTVVDPTAYAPQLRNLSPGYARFRYTVFASDRKQRSQDFAIRVWSKKGGVDAGFPYDAPKPPPASSLGWGGTIRDRRDLFSPPPTSGNRG